MFVQEVKKKKWKDCQSRIIFLRARISNSYEDERIKF